jgi:hypothetical protein
MVAEVGWGELVERTTQLAYVEQTLAGATAGTGGLLLIEGEPGIGKTALVRAAERLAADRGIRVLTARAGELEQAHSFGVVRELFARDRRRFGDQSELFSGAAAMAASVLSPAEARYRLRPLHRRAWAVLVRRRLAATEPTLLSVDDAHWCDVPSLKSWHIMRDESTGFDCFAGCKSTGDGRSPA